MLRPGASDTEANTLQALCKYFAPQSKGLQVEKTERRKLANIQADLWAKLCKINLNLNKIKKRSVAPARRLVTNYKAQL